MDRIVTVTGEAVADPCNFKAKLGTSFADLLEAAGGFKQPAKKIISGGPMMGFAMFDYHVPVVKTSSAMLCMTEDDISEKEPTACINCGRCVNACPARLVPQDWLPIRNMDRRNCSKNITEWNVWSADAAALSVRQNVH